MALTTSYVKVGNLSNSSATGYGFWYSMNTNGTVRIHMGWARNSSSYKGNYGAASITNKYFTLNGTNYQMTVGTTDYSGGWGRKNYNWTTTATEIAYVDIPVTIGSDNKSAATTVSYNIKDSATMTGMTGSVQIPALDWSSTLPALTVSVTGNSYTYDGSAHNPVINVKSGSTNLSGVKVETGLSTSYNNSWSQSGTTNTSGNINTGTSAQWTNAGTYTIYYRASKSGYATKTGSFTITVSQATNSWTTAGATMGSKVYTGSAQNIVTTTPVPKFGTVEYSLNNSTWSSTKPTATNVGSGTLYWRTVANDNYTQITGSGTWAVTKATNSWTTAPTSVSKMYTGSAITLVANTPVAKFGTVEYSLNNSTWSTTKPTATAIGSYTVYYRVSGTSNYTGLSGSMTSKITSNEVTVTINIPNAARLRYKLREQNGSTTEGNTSYARDVDIDLNGYTWDQTNNNLIKSFEIGDSLDFPGIQAWINGCDFIYADTPGTGWANSRNSSYGPVGYMMLGYSTSNGGALTYRETGGSYTISAALNLYPRLMWFKTSAAIRNKVFDNTDLYFDIKPQPANTTYYEIAATGVQVFADLSAKDAATAPNATTSRVTSTTAGSSYNLVSFKDAGTRRLGIKLTITQGGETFTKANTGVNNPDSRQVILKADRNLTLNKTALTMVTNTTDTSVKATAWDNLDNSASTVNLLSASTRAQITPSSVAKNGTVTIKTGWYPGQVNLLFSIPETDNYNADTATLALTITNAGNGIWWYDGTQWVLTEPYVWNGASWSNDFI